MVDLKIELSSEKISSSTSDTLLITKFEDSDIPKFLKRAEIIDSVIKSGDFQGKDAQINLVYTYGKLKPKRIILVGLGKKENFHLNKFRLAIAQAINLVRSIGVKEFVIPIYKINEAYNIRDLIIAASEAVILANHKYDAYKSDKIMPSLKLVKLVTEDKITVKEKEALSYSLIVTENSIKARDLINTPATIATPVYIADLAKKLAKGKYKCVIYDKKSIKKLGMNALLAVSSGSINEPRLVILDYNPKRAKKTIALVGKGVTFDSGGLSLKPSIGMETMKDDKSGACVVLYTVLAASQLKLPLRVIGVLALTENMISAASYKPGDIIKTMSGKTVEVLNTDAEGRIILADALHYAHQKFKPDYIIDIATLTGACIVALGSEASGLLGNNQALMDSLKDAGEKTYERLWQLPMFEEYGELIKSDFADIKNVVSNMPGSSAGVITGAKFLEEFIKQGVKWAHIDIAGTSWMDAEKGYKPRGATGFGVRLLTQFLKEESRK